MGGLGGDNGHLNHLYEDYDLTFGRLSELLNLVMENKLTLYEKVDGQNLSLTHNPKLHKTFAARNKSDIKSGGIDVDKMSARYSKGDKDKVRIAFTSAMKAFYKSVMDLTYYQRFQTFDSSLGGIPFVNLEVMSTINPNVIEYSGNYLVMHGVTRYGKGTASGTSCDDTFKSIVSSIANSVIPTPEGLWMIKGPTEIDLSRTSSKQKMQSAIQSLTDFMNDNHLEDDDTIRDFIEGQIVLSHLKDIEISGEVENEFLNRMLDVPNTRPTPSIVKNVDWSTKEMLTSVAKNRKAIIKKIVRPLELIINDFGVGLLENSHSSFVENGKSQIDRLRQRTQSAINEIREEADATTLSKLDMNLEKLGEDLNESITSTVEGVVFDDPVFGSKYKITGAFAPMNQILGFVNPAFKSSRKTGSASETGTVPMISPVFVA